MAKYLHIGATIFVPDFMDKATQQKIESEGGRVIVVDGNYDYSIKCAQDEAKKNGILVMDVSWEGYEEIPEVLSQRVGRIAITNLGSGSSRGT
jgi:diaminopropionate ammonia-lyase